MKNNHPYRFLALITLVLFIAFSGCSLQITGDLPSDAQANGSDFSITFSDVTYDNTNNIIRFLDVTIENLGENEADAFPLAFLLSCDDTIFNSDDILLGQNVIYCHLPKGQKTTLDSGSSKFHITNLYCPSGFKAYIILDYGRNYGESTYRNNVYVKPERVLVNVPYASVRQTAFSSTNALFKFNYYKNADSVNVYRSIDDTNHFSLLTNVTGQYFNDTDISIFHDYHYKFVTKYDSEEIALSTSALSYSPQIIRKALDHEGLYMNSYGDASWIYDADCHTGSNSLRSGETGYSSNSVLEIPFYGEYVEFFWKVSSDPSLDSFDFYIDDLKKASIKGNNDWSKAQFGMITGQHTLKWIFSKGGSSGPDMRCGWVDSLSNQPSSIDAPTNLIIASNMISSAVLTWHPAPFVVNYEIYRSIDNSGSYSLLGVSSNSNYVDTSILSDHNYYYMLKSVIGAMKSDFSKKTFLLNNFNEVLDTTGLAWTSGSNAPWELDPDHYILGNGSLLCSNLSAGKIKTIQTTFTGDYISFNWKLITDISHSGSIHFYVDGSDLGSLYSISDWTYFRTGFSYGTHTLKWVFYNYSTPVNSYTGWLDSIRFEPANLDMPGGLLSYVTKGIRVPLQWNWVPGATYYDILRSTNNISYDIVGTNVSCYYTDKTVSPDENYYYKVVAKRGLLASPASEPFFALNDLNSILDTTGLAWTKFGYQCWFEDTNFYTNGTSSLICSNEDSCEVYIVTTFTGDYVSFKWNLPGYYTCGCLAFFIDDEQKAYVYSTAGWETRSFSLPYGTHKIKWKFTKDSIVWLAAWLDGITFTP